jgi:hypothetical protein
MKPGQIIARQVDDHHANAQDAGFREHLGASVVGRPCERALWYSFHWVTPAHFDGRMLRLFRRGQNEEQIFVDDLEAIGIEVLADNPATGDQWRFSKLNGHLGGSTDGFARNVGDYGDTPFILEMKTHGSKSFRKLELAEEKGEASPVLKCKPEHWVQMQLYMGWQGFAHALYLAVNKDTDALYIEVVDFDQAGFDHAMAKAGRVLNATQPPNGVSDDPEYWLCRFCDHNETCHGERIAAANCRTCAFSTPVTTDGDPWVCERHTKPISGDDQRAGCSSHLFIPDLVPGTALDHFDNAAGVMVYQVNGESFRNGPRESGGWPSSEMGGGNVGTLMDDGLQSIVNAFDGQVEGWQPIDPPNYDDVPF